MAAAESHARADRRRNDILEVAFDVFANKDFRDSTIADIAKRLRIGHGTVYRYFENKHQIFDQVVPLVIERIAAALANEAPDATNDLAGYRAQVRRIAEQLLSLLDSDPRAPKLLFIEASGVSVEMNRKLSDLWTLLGHVTEAYLVNGKQKGFLRKDLDTAVTAHKHYRVDGLMGLMLACGLSAAGDVRSFDAHDPKNTLSDDVSLTGDAAGVAFFRGTKIACVVQAPNPLTSPMGGHDVIDVSDPTTPVVLESVRDASAHASCPAVAHAKRKSVIVPAVVAGMLQLLEYKLKDNKAVMVAMTPVTTVTLFGAFHVTVDPQGRVLCAVPREHFLTVTDLKSSESFVVDWGGSAPGPTDVQMIP